MNRTLCLLVAAALLAAGCRGDEEPPAEEAAVRLAEMARSSDALTYKAAYRYVQRGPIAESVETRLEIVQRPPESLRKIQTTTHGEQGRTFTETSWFVSKASGGEDAEVRFYSCFGGDFSTRSQDSIRCIESPSTGMFGKRQIDEVFEFARDPQESFEELRQIDGTRVAGLEATCFEGTHRARSLPAATPPASPTPSSTLFQPEVYRLQICYSSEGILLRAHRSIVEPAPTGEGTVEQLLEATAVSQEVKPSDIRLPGKLPEEGEASPRP